MNKKGSAAIWLLFMVLIVIISSVYAIFTYPVASIEQNMRVYINDTVGAGNSTIASEALTTMDTLASVWKYWPLFLLFGLGIWVMVSMQKKEPIYE